MKKLTQDDKQDIEVIKLENPGISEQDALKRLRNRKSADALDMHPRSLDEASFIPPQETQGNYHIEKRVEKARNKACLYFPEILIVALENGWSISETARDLEWSRGKVRLHLERLKAFLRKELED